LEKRSRKEEFSRLIWISPISKTQATSSGLLSTRSVVNGSTGRCRDPDEPLEDFKNIMREELLESLQLKDADEYTGKSIYLVHDRVDHTEVKPFMEVIEKSGFKVLIPEFEGDLLELRKNHIENCGI